MYTIKSNQDDSGTVLHTSNSSSRRSRELSSRVAADLIRVSCVRCDVVNGIKFLSCTLSSK